MPHKIVFLEEAVKDWLNLDHSIRKRLEKTIERLKSDPEKYGKPLGRSLRGLRRIRGGDFRVVYHVEESSKTVAIVVVCHRKDVYQIALQRRLV